MTAKANSNEDHMLQVTEFQRWISFPRPDLQCSCHCFFFLKFKQIAQTKEAAIQQVESAYEQLRSEVNNDMCLFCHDAINIWGVFVFKSALHV